MIIGIGIDIVDIERFSKSIETDGFTERLFTEKEINQARNFTKIRKYEYFAGRFALKESFFKAIGTGVRIHSLQDVEILFDELGKPQFLLKNLLYSIYPPTIYNIHATVSHERKYAIGFVIIERIK